MRMPDLFKRMKRGPQIITLKDASIIAGFTGVSPGDIVIDAGAGSGFLSVFLANLVRPGGRVIAYEKRPEFAAIARGNIEKAGLSKFAEVKEKDISEGISEKDVDVITLDMRDPWTVMEHAAEALKKGGFLVTYVPNIEQVKQSVLSAGKAGLRHEETVECSLRGMLIRDFGVRPETKGITHTGYISFFRAK